MIFPLKLHLWRFYGNFNGKEEQLTIITGDILWDMNPRDEGVYFLMVTNDPVVWREQSSWGIHIPYLMGSQGPTKSFPAT